MADEVRKEKGVFIPKEQRQPDAPEYLKMSKADVVKAEQKRREKAAKVKAFAKQLDEEEQAAAPKPPTPEKGKKGKSQKPGERV